MTTLWHYTDDKGHESIGHPDGELVPLGMLITLDDARLFPEWSRELVSMVWLTDLDQPWRDALGLTSNNIRQDRTKHRYRVTGGRAVSWTTVRRLFDRRMTNHLETAPGALPAHWYVAFAPVRVIYDPPHER